MGYYPSPEAALGGRVDLVIAALEYEEFCLDYEAVSYEMSRRKSKCR